MDQVLEIAEMADAIRGGHFVLTSGLHSDGYVDKNKIYPNTEYVSDICWLIAKEFKDNNIEAIIGPAIGGVILSQWTAHHLSKITKNNVLSLYAEKTSDGKGFIIQRGYDKLLRGKRILVVEDVVTTGTSVKKVIDSTIELGGIVVGLAIICNRGGVTPEQVSFSGKFLALTNVSFSTYKEGECPLCKNVIPIDIDAGKGREYLAKLNSGGTLG